MAEPEAIGLIETRGFVPLVVAVDAMTKAAQVRLLSCENVGNGLVAAVIGGDIASVEYATDVGAAAASRVGEVVAVRIIGRLVGNIGELLPLGQNGHAWRGGLPPEPDAQPALAPARAVPRLVAAEVDVPRLPAGQSLPAAQPRRPSARRRPQRNKAPRVIVEVRTEITDPERGRRKS